jgi:hypothetical protein
MRLPRGLRYTLGWVALILAAILCTYGGVTRLGS